MNMHGIRSHRTIDLAQPGSGNSPKGVSRSRTVPGRNRQGPPRGPFSIWRRGWDGRCAAPKAASPLRSSGGMGAARPGLPLRGCARRTGFEILDPLGENAKGPVKGPFRILAERVGFEPTVRCNRTPDFESGPFDHSGTSPGLSHCYRGRACGRPRVGDIGEQSGQCQVSIRPATMR